MRRVNSLRVAKNNGKIGRLIFWMGFATLVFGVVCRILSCRIK
jgi:hypothetical protein